jgi:L-alanine-DL-glutamate epimerase-like enolase superfamily enzyme
MPDLGIEMRAGRSTRQFRAHRVTDECGGQPAVVHDDIIDPPIELRDGMIELPDRPGLGYTVK